ncbi:roundabout homolog 1-like isoform X1 [Dermacentor andersoni]|uniref:roundabout homolog 1-like isoform X1 n=1 Tax=Dermacentor andersoni TaxID=34620 RepID=UPI003B3A7636
MASRCDRRQRCLLLRITKASRIIASSLVALLLCAAIAADAASSHEQRGGEGDRAPRITEQPVDVVVRKHEPVTLRCGADGDPPPRIAWFHDGRPVRDSATRMVLPEGQLFFLQVQHSRREQDTGLYWCTAANALGTTRSRNASVELAALRDEFRQLPKSVHAAAGDSATLECVPPRGHPEPTVTWFKDGVQVQPGTGRVRLLAQGALLIADVRPSDQGRYVCRAANMLGTRDSPSALLSVHTKPYFIRVPEDVTALAGESVEFLCKVNGDPKPTVTWRRKDGKMPIGRAYVQEDKSFNIKNVAPSDEGSYACEIENIVGSTSASATLVVHSRPAFRLTPMNQKVGINGVAKFDCVATGNPPPSVFWTREGSQVLMFPGKSHGRFSVSQEGTLTITGVRREDRGYYVCSVLSAVGSSMAKGRLEVNVLTDVPPPIIRLGPANQTLPVRTTTQLPCEVAGTPKPTVQWFYSAAPLSIKDRPRFKILGSGTLQIRDLQLSDSGLYTCKASSENGETSWTASLAVESPHNPNVNFHRSPEPSTLPDPPSQPFAVNTTETSVTLTWRGSENIGASSLKGYTIEYHSSDLQSGWVLAAHRVLTETYTIQDLQPDSRYIFIVRTENSHGVGLPSPISEIIRTPGLAPLFEQDSNLDEVREKLSTNVVTLHDIRTVSSTAVKLTWKIQGSKDFVEGFYIRFRDLSVGSQTYNIVTVLNGEALSYVLNDLKKFTKYNIFLVPFCRSVEGPPSNSRTVQTLEDVPTAPPDGVEVQVLNGTTVTILWSPPPPQHRNGRLRGYNVYVDGSSSDLHLNKSTNSTTNRLTFDNLKTGILYEARVVAATTAGGGPASSPIHFKIEGTSSSTSLSRPFEKIVTQPWFIALIGFLLLVAATSYVLFLIRKRRLEQAKAITAAQEIKPDDIRNYFSSVTGPACLSHQGASWINYSAWRPSEQPKVAFCETQLLNKMNCASDEHNYSSVYATLNCDMNAPEYAEVDGHNLTTFNKKDARSVLEPYATTTLIKSSFQKSRNASSTDASSGRSPTEGSRKSGKASDLEMRHANEDGVSDRLLRENRLASPESESGSYTGGEYGMPTKKSRLKISRGGVFAKVPVMNWSEIIPPPPEKPPSEAGSRPNTPASFREPSLHDIHIKQKAQDCRRQELVSSALMDLEVHSSLPSLDSNPPSLGPAEQSRAQLRNLNGHIYQDANADSDMEDMSRRPSLQSSFAGDTDCMSSHAPSWTSVAEQSNSSCTSGCSSGRSSYDDSVYNEVDFARAFSETAKIADHRVSGSTIMTERPAARRVCRIQFPDSAVVL